MQARAPALFKALRAMVVVASMYPEVYNNHKDEIESYHHLLNKAEGKSSISRPLALVSEL